MGLARTVSGGIASFIGNVVGSIVGIYWTESSLSLMGMMLYQLLFLGVLFFLWLGATSFYYRLPTMLLPHGLRAQRRFFCCTLCPRGCKRNVAGKGGVEELDEEVAYTSTTPATTDDAEKELFLQKSSSSSTGMKHGNVQQEQEEEGEHDEEDDYEDQDDEQEQGRKGVSSSSSLSKAQIVNGGWLGKLTQVEFMFVMGMNNMLAAATQFYATPPDRTPPLLQAIFPIVSIVASIPMSKFLLGDTKKYSSREPLLSVVLIAIAVAVSLLPSLTSSSNSENSSSSSSSSSKSSAGSTAAWCGVFLFSQCSTALAFVTQQAFLVREGVLSPGTPKLRLQISMMRLLAYNQVFVVIGLLALWWIDILPWFGSTTGGVSDWASGILFSFSCSLLGPSGVSADAQNESLTCTESSPIYALVFLVSYTVYLAGTLLVNTDSAVFTTALSVVITLALSIFWLIPGTNPDPTYTPLWSVGVAVVLSIVGMVVLKRWESQTPIEEQFLLEPLDCMLTPEMRRELRKQQQEGKRRRRKEKEAKENLANGESGRGEEVHV